MELATRRAETATAVTQALGRRREARWLEELACTLMGLQQRFDLPAQALVAGASPFQVGGPLISGRDLHGLDEEGFDTREL